MLTVQTYKPGEPIFEFAEMLPNLESEKRIGRYSVVFPAATTADDIGCFIRKPVDMDDLVKRIKAEIQ